jgi:hypothetical protein
MVEVVAKFLHDHPERGHYATSLVAHTPGLRGRVRKGRRAGFGRFANAPKNPLISMRAERPGCQIILLILHSAAIPDGLTMKLVSWASTAGTLRAQGNDTDNTSAPKAAFSTKRRRLGQPGQSPCSGRWRSSVGSLVAAPKPNPKARLFHHQYGARCQPHETIRRAANDPLIKL